MPFLKIKDIKEVVTVSAIALKFYNLENLHKGRGAVFYWKNKLGLHPEKVGNEIIFSIEDASKIEEKLGIKRKRIEENR